MPDTSDVPSGVDVTQLLRAWGHGDEGALGRLIPVVQQELHRRAQRYMRREKPDHTLQTTALVNEVYLRLVDIAQVSWQDRAHFFAIAARMMRRILTDFARSRNYQKRGGAVLHVSFEDALAVSKERDVEIMALDEALAALATVDARKSQVVELRFFGGLSVEETAEILKVSPETVKRDWRFARSWLHRALGGGKADGTDAPAAS